MYKIMTPGPVQVPENVRLARSRSTTNADLDPVFYDEYKELCELISELLHTKNETLILSGEGILGLEAACATLTEPGDRVLVLDNGIYGAGFADFVTMYGGEPVLYTTDYLNEIDVDAFAEFLKDNHDFKYAAVVHCDTPSGVLNDVHRICPLLKSYGILSVVDSVSGMFGNELDIDQGQMDIVCGGSQKAVSAPPGLTFVTISDDAKKAMENRKVPVASFYCNLNIFKDYYEKQWFPYTMPISDIYGLVAAMENIKNDADLYTRHHKIAVATRKAIEEAGLTNHLQSGFSDTVTVFNVPEGLTANDILNRMQEAHGIMLAGSFGDLEGKVIRIGHMGASANEADMIATLAALDETLAYLGWEAKATLVESFQKNFV
ncbi:MAG: alanine--glyoxylate aminotransferase family protein [Lachnospiraceae bacterium]|nr:alanine--glyoxylate aminotransferase family protein [Lachnospiraceae bacterium]